MNSPSSLSSNNRDLEAQLTSSNGGLPTPNSDEVCEERGGMSGGGGEFKARSQSEPEWKPWKLSDPYITELPKDERDIEDWVKVMKESDNGMCQGWTDQIDTLIIFAGLFSATVTAFTIESYKWLDESHTDMLARLQLRELLSATQDPATVDRLAPATFEIDPFMVSINTLWFSSLTLALAAVVVSILCKQWLYEYQRYENFTIKETFLIHGLRYRGLQAWNVPTIIAFLPIVLQAALMLFLVGLLVLLWPRQIIVAAVNTAIVGLTVIFLVLTTILPAIQYVFPFFNTQCAYKSSQSWSFLWLFTFWLFDFRMFTNWSTFDRWEVTHICDGMGHTLSRVYELLSSSLDAFQKIYGFLAETSLKPAANSDLAVLSDFVTGLDPSRRDGIVKAIPHGLNTGESSDFQRLHRVKDTIKQRYVGRLRPGPDVVDTNPQSDKPKATNHTYQLQTQMILGQILRKDVHISNSEVFNRYVEHWARCINDTGDNLKQETQWKTGDKRWMDIFWPTNLAHDATIDWNPEIASRVIKLYSYLLRTNQFSLRAMYCLAAMYSSFIESHHQSSITPSPFTLLKDIQDWIDETANFDVAQAVDNADRVAFCLVSDQLNVFSDLSRVSDPEKQYLSSFAKFFLDFFQRRDVSSVLHRRSISPPDLALAIMRDYLSQNPYVGS